MSNFLAGIVYSSIFFVLFICLELVSRNRRYSKEVTRKIAHVLSGIFGIFMAFVSNYWVFIFFCTLFFLIISVSYLKNLFTSIHNVKRKTLGEIFLPIGILAAYVVSGGSGNIFLVSVLILTISDPLAGIAGNTLKLKTFSYNGSVAFFISAFLILFIFVKMPILYLFIIALVTAFVERISKYGSDNITIPLVVSMALHLFL